EGDRLGKPFYAEAASAIVTLPLGVLQQRAGEPGAVRFLPALKEKRAALAAIASGPALKVNLRFRSPFWERLDSGRYGRAGFFQAPEAVFPAFWTAFPVSSSMLVAWAGGPRARRMSGLSPEEIVRRAAASVQTLFGGRLDVAQELEG